MNVLVSCKNAEVPIKNEGTRVVTTFLPLYVYGDFFRHSRADNSASIVGSGKISNSIRNFMIVLVTCKNEEDPIKNQGARVLTRFSIL